MSPIERTPTTPVGNYIDALIDNKRCRVLIDTGAHYSCMNLDFAKRLGLALESSSSSFLPQLLSAASEPLDVVGYVNAHIAIGGYTFTTNFVIIENLYHNVIFGLDMLRDNNAVIDIASSTFTIADDLATVPLIHRYAKSNILRTVHSITLEPSHEVRIPVRISPKYTLEPSLVEPLPTKYNKKCAVAKIFVEPKERTTICQLVNLSDKPCVIPARTAIATISPAVLVSSSTNDNNSASDTALRSDETETTHEQKLKTLTDKGFRLTCDNLTQQQFTELVSLLYEYKDAFASDINELPGVKGVEYEVKLQPGTRPKRQRQYRYSPELRQVIRDQLKEWEKAGIAKEGDSYWSHPVVLVKKKSDGSSDTPPKYRMCLDLRELNKCVILEQFPLPTFENIIDCLGDPPPCYLTLLDALHGYLQLNVTEESSRFLGVESDEKSYVLRRLPFGLATSPHAYQKLMNSLLSPYQFVFAAAYLDDLLVYLSLIHI